MSIAASPPGPVPVVPLSGAASRFLTLLRDFGHLTEEELSRVVVAAVDRAVVEGRERVEVSELRPIAAAILFAPNAQRPSDPSLLDEDWGLLFS